MKEIICPICGKHDIPDFLSQDVVCPCCGSDLSIYRLVGQIKADSKSKPKAKTKSNKPTIYAFASAIVILLLVSGLLITRVSGYAAKLSASEAKYEALVIENEALKGQISQSEDNIESNKELSGFKYIVREGDSFWSISKKLYGTGTRYKEIADANNLTITAVLNIGDELIIK
jgi:nucleoid-associated protein YgaU